MRTARHLTACAAALLTLASCTASVEPRAAATTSTRGSAAADPPGQPAISVEGAPTALAAVVQQLYAKGGPAPAAKVGSGKAILGTWRGEQVAVVTAADDVTLAVGTGGSWRIVGGWWPSLGIDSPSLGKAGPRWVLALGSDARPGQDMARTRADVLQVAGVDGKGGGGILGLPRDLWVPLSTGGTAKINAAMVTGGPTAQLETVRRTTGLALEGYVLIGFKGFTSVVDEQGGIPIVVPQRVQLGKTGPVINAGPQTLTGAQALAYARERKSLPDGDFGRSRHQGEILLAAAIKAKLAGPQAIPSAMTSLDRVAQSNLTAEQLLTFAASLYRLSPFNVGRGVAFGSTGWAGKQSIVIVGKHARTLFTDFKDGNLS